MEADTSETFRGVEIDETCRRGFRGIRVFGEEGNQAGEDRVAGGYG